MCIGLICLESEFVHAGDFQRQSSGSAAFSTQGLYSRWWTAFVTRALLCCWGKFRGITRVSGELYLLYFFSQLSSCLKQLLVNFGSRSLILRKTRDCMSWSPKSVQSMKVQPSVDCLIVHHGLLLTLTHRNLRRRHVSCFFPVTANLCSVLLKKSPLSSRWFLLSFNELLYLAFPHSSFVLGLLPYPIEICSWTVEWWLSPVPDSRWETAQDPSPFYRAASIVVALMSLLEANQWKNQLIWTRLASLYWTYGY